MPTKKTLSCRSVQCFTYKGLACPADESLPGPRSLLPPGGPAHSDRLRDASSEVGLGFKTARSAYRGRRHCRTQSLICSFHCSYFICTCIFAGRALSATVKLVHHSDLDVHNLSFASPGASPGGRAQGRVQGSSSITFSTDCHVEVKIME